MTQMGNPSQAGQWSQPNLNISDVASSTNCTQIWVGTRIVGVVKGGEFIKKVKGSRHFLRRPPAIAFDISSLDEARACGASSVHVIDDETGKSYRASISTILANGFRFNRGHGDQIGLKLVYWLRNNDPLATQLGLWG